MEVVGKPHARVFVHPAVMKNRELFERLATTLQDHGHRMGEVAPGCTVVAPTGPRGGHEVGRVWQLLPTGGTQVQRMDGVLVTVGEQGAA